MRCIVVDEGYHRPGVYRGPAPHCEFPLKRVPYVRHGLRLLLSVEFLGRHESLARTKQCFGKNWDRLAELKKRYDPDCFFKNNFWPLDREGQPVEPLTNEPPSP